MRRRCFTFKITRIAHFSLTTLWACSLALAQTHFVDTNADSAVLTPIRPRSSPTVAAAVARSELYGIDCHAEPRSVPVPPNDIEVFNTIRRIQIEYAETESESFVRAKQTGRDIVLRALESLSLDELTPYQVMLLEPFIELGAYQNMRPEQQAAFAVSLNRAAKRTDAIGTIALSQLASLNWDSHGSEHLRRLLRHPGLEDAMHGWPAARIINSFGSLHAPVVLEHLDEIERTISYMLPHTRTKPLDRPALMRLFEKLDDPAIAEKTRDARHRIHAHLLAVARATLSRFAPMSTTYTTERHWIDAAVDVIEYLEGPAASGSIINRPAPDLEFLWWRGPDRNPQRLLDLRGRVIVLDFWATWCRPCIVNFPVLRDLQAHYADRDVVVVGITSIQGFHVPVNEPIVMLKDQGGNAAESELELMARFMERNDITWNIAFSTRSVIDARYEVWGIPHFTIIDANGIVRHNGVHLSETTLAQTIEIIDALLSEGSMSDQHDD